MHQLERIRRGEPVEDQHKTRLRKKLRFTGNLRVFDRTLEQLLEKETKNIQIYMAEINPVFARLALKNRYTNTMQLAYFAYVIKKYHIIQEKRSPEIMSMMMDLLQEPGLYCRENAIQAIYSTGDCNWVLRGLHTIDENEYFHHQKLLTDGLLNFPGDQAQLAQSLWDAFPTFSVFMQVVILDYIRFSGVNTLQSELLSLLVDDKTDDELRFSCIRYFGKYSCKAA